MPPDAEQSSVALSKKARDEISWIEVAPHNTESSSWTVFEQKVYDITDFITRHPGGEIIRLAAGRDATPLITSYHTRKSLILVRKALKSQCKCLGSVVDHVSAASTTTSTASDQSDSDDPDKHQDSLKRRRNGADKVDTTTNNSKQQPAATASDIALPANTKYEQSPTDGVEFWEDCQDRVDAFLKENNLPKYGNEGLALLELLLTMCVYMVSLWYRATHVNYFVAVFTGIMMARMGFLMHAGNHCGQSKKKWLNRVAGLQMSLVGSNHVVWSYEHQVSHHISPNEIGKDNDCEIGKPWLRFHPDIKREWWHKYQHIVTMTAISIGLIKWFFSDFVRYFSHKAGNVRFRPTQWDITLLLFFKSVWIFTNIVLPIRLIGFGSAMGQVLVSCVVGAHYMEQTFIVNHTQRGLVPHHHESASGEPMHWAKKQILGTANWASGSMLWTWVSGGLNHQIEHHLYPAMSMYNYPRISHIVKATCEEHRIPYHNFSSFASAHSAMLSYLKDLGRYDEVK